LWDQYEEQLLGLACDGSRPGAEFRPSAGGCGTARGECSPEASG
jgi:hypothetical protein